MLLNNTKIDLWMSTILPKKRWSDISELEDIRDYISGPLFTFLFDLKDVGVDFPSNLVIG